MTALTMAEEVPPPGLLTDPAKQDAVSKLELVAAFAARAEVNDAKERASVAEQAAAEAVDKELELSVGAPICCCWSEALLFSGEAF